MLTHYSLTVENIPIKLHLAPMEGVMDFVFRDLVSGLGGLDLCTTEFIRVTTELVPDHVFFRTAPELKMNSQTRSQTPLAVQLLGGKPEPMARNALRLSQLGAGQIDLNFGCPAKTVNKNDGGACLLKTPERLFEVVSAVRKAVPPHIPVTAKMRLGYSSPALCVENALALQEAGAAKVTVHARTKEDGYKPPAHWEYLSRIKERISVPLIANGDIWNYEDLLRCQTMTGCSEFMIGRGALKNPFIFSEIKSRLQTHSNEIETPWAEQFKLLYSFFEANETYSSAAFAQSRSKQFLRYLSEKHEPAKEIFDRVKIINDPTQFKQALRN